MSRERRSRCRRFKAGATLLIGLAAGCLLPGLRVGEASAQGANPSLPRTSPLPPRRPSELGGQPAQPAERPPATGLPGASEPPSVSQPHTATDSQPDAQLDREAISRCGSQWQKMKMDGSAAGMSWRDFARECSSRTRLKR